jgi:hypothetical protein
MSDKNVSSEGVGDEIFSLPLSIFEYYMFLDDCVGNVMTIPLSILVEGKIDRAAMEKSYFEACRIHPLFSATISSRDRRWRGVKELEGIIWLDSGDDDSFPWDEQHIDITQSTGLRFAIADRGDSSVFHFLFHHCVADGVGFFQFLETLFEYYLKNTGQNILPKRYEISNLSGRSKYKLIPPPRRVTLFSAVKFMVVETLRWFIRRPFSPISREYSELSSLSRRSQLSDKREIDIVGERVQIDLRRWGDSGFIFSRLNRDLTSRIISKSKSNKFTIGEILLSSLFISLACSKSLSFFQTGDKIKEIHEDDLLRVGVVNNMRGVGAEEIPACNIISYSFPTRRFAECKDELEFHKKISEELRYVKDYSVGKTFIDGLSIFLRIPYFRRKFIDSNRCLASVILSSMNRLELLFSSKFSRDELGRVRVGDLTLVDFYAAAPYRRGTPISITTNTYAGQLGFFVQYNAKKISSDDAEKWITEWLNIIAK